MNNIIILTHALWAIAVAIFWGIGYMQGRKIEKRRNEAAETSLKGLETVLKTVVAMRELILAKAQQQREYPSGGVLTGAVIPHGKEVIINRNGKITPLSPEGGISTFHAVGLDPNGFDKMVEAIRNLQKSQPDGTENE